MPRVRVNGVEIFYELDGTGEETVVLLNGIMMSTASWSDSVNFYTRNGYRLLRVDFRDQGQSEKSNEPYEIDQHVEDLRELFIHLGLSPVHMVGTSYGGQVALLFALKYGHMLKTLILANTSARLTNHLKAIGEAWDEAAKLNSGLKFFRLAMPFIYSSPFYESNYEWLKDREKNLGEALTAEWFAAYLRLSSSHGSFDILERLSTIKVPTLLISAEKDIVTPLEEMIKIHRAIKGSVHITIPEAGHASFYEKKEAFHTAVLGFLALNRAR